MSFTNLKNILNDIVDAQKKSKENKLTFDLKEESENAEEESSSGH